jgi:hypothetical protein
MASLHVPEGPSPLIASSHLLRSSQYDLGYLIRKNGSADLQVFTVVVL